MDIAWWKIISVFLLSTVKFVFGGVPLALGYGFSFLEAVTVTSLGGFLGVIVFVFLSDKLILYFRERAKIRREKNLNLPPKKKFNRTNRIIITVKNRFGLLGFALIVPFLIPIPLGCFLAVRYFQDKPRIILFMFISVIMWSSMISSIELLF